MLLACPLSPFASLLSSAIPYPYYCIFQLILRSILHIVALSVVLPLLFLAGPSVMHTYTSVCNVFPFPSVYILLRALPTAAFPLMGTSPSCYHICTFPYYLLRCSLLSVCRYFFVYCSFLFLLGVGRLWLLYITVILLCLPLLIIAIDFCIDSSLPEQSSSWPCQTRPHTA